MDAAQSSFKKIFFLSATALLLTTPFHTFAQPLNLSSTSVTIGSSGCNDSQNVTVASSNGSNETFSVAVQYANGNQFGNWLYTDLTLGGGATSNGTAFTATTSTSGVSLTIGLNYGLAANTATASVMVTPAGGTAQYITVYYSQNSSCGGNTGTAGNGFVSVSPGNISLTAPTNGQQSQSVTVQNVGGGSYAFSVSVSPANSWLSASSSSVALNPGATTTINVTATGAQTAGVGSYTGSLSIAPQQGYAGTTVNIPVTFSVTNGTSTGTGGSGSTLTLNGATSNTYTATFDYIAPNAPGGQCIPIQDTASGASGYSTSVTTSSGGNWLLANNQISVFTPQLLAASYAACVNLTLNPAVAFGLGNGAYQGSVAITSSSGATATISVNYYVSAGAAPGVTVTAQGQSSSGLVYVFPNVASGSSVVQQESFTITAASGYTLGAATLNGSGTGFTLSSPSASNNSESFTITSNSSGLVTGIYTATITTTSSLNNQANTTTITLVQPVGQSGATSTGTGGNGTGTATAAPGSLAFQQQQSNSFWTSGKEAQTLSIVGPSGSQWSAQIVYGSGAGWLNFDTSNSGTLGSGPATLSVDLSNGVSSLAAGNYQATVSITVGSQTVSVAVTLLVTASNSPVLIGTPAVTTFAATTGTTPSSQSVTIVGSDNTGSLTSPPISAGTPTATWVTAATSGNTLTTTVNLTGLTTGIYSATIPISASAYSNPINYPVVLVLNGGGGGQGGTGTAGLTLGTTALSYSNVTSTTTQNLSVTASTSTSFNLTSGETTCTGSTWLSVTNGGYTASTTSTSIPVTVNPSGIANGTTCNGLLTLVTSAGTQLVSVTMTVGTTSGGGNVTVSPTSLTFADTQGQSAPAAQTITVVNTTSGTASIAFTVSTAETNGTSVTWLQTSATSGTTPDNSPGLSISVAPGSLAPGTYTGTVTITPTGGTAQTVAVTMTVTGTATVSAAPTSLNWSYTVGGAAPSGAVQVSAGGATAAFTATAASTGGWLQVTPTSGTTPNTGTSNLTVSTVSTALAALTPSSTPYTGTITVQGTSPASGTTIVNVNLTVTAPLPQISGITNTASGVGGATNVSVSPGELISIYANPANPIGPATSVALNSTNCPNGCTQLPTTLGGVTVRFLPGNELAPLLFVNEGQINAIVPYTVAGIASLSIEVEYLNQTSNTFPVTLVATAPGIFTANDSGTGLAASYQIDNLGNFQGYNTPAAPAKVGWTIVLYMTGEGIVSPLPTSGAVTSPTGNPDPVPLVMPHVLVGNQPATVYYAEAPGIVSGVLQLNVVIPPGAGTGAVPVSVSLGTTSSQAGVTVSLQ